jgi:hypothetical protein
LDRQEYEKRLATAIRLLGEEAGRRYMGQRLWELRGKIEAQVRQAVRLRLEGLHAATALELSLEIGPEGVQVRRKRCRRA